MPSYMNPVNVVGKSSSAPAVSNNHTSKAHVSLSNSIFNPSFTLESVVNSDEYKLYMQQLLNAYMYQQVCYFLILTMFLERPYILIFSRLSIFS